MTEPSTRVNERDGTVHIEMPEGKVSLPLRPLPEEVMEWFMAGRKAGYESLSRGEGPGPFFSRHLPVVATSGGSGPHSIRLAHKGVGFLPRPGELPEQVARYEELLDRTGKLDPEQSLRERLAAAARSLEGPSHPDGRLLGSLEIFEGETFANLSRRPFASLLFTDPEGGYRSFQLDCAVEIIEPPDLRFRYLFLARSLFERDPFHITQPGVRCGYLFWVTGVHDKTPHPVDEGRARHRL